MPGFWIAALLIFLLGCALILAGRRYARAMTALLAAAIVMLGLFGLELTLDRIGVPSGDAETGRLFWPKR